MVLFSQQAKNTVSDDLFLNDKLTTTDVCLGITKQNSELNFWKRAINFFFGLFDIEVFQNPNTKIYTLKNRYANSPLSIDYTIDYVGMNKSVK